MNTTFLPQGIHPEELHNNTATHNGTEHEGGIHVVGWNFHYVAKPLLLTLFIIAASLLKLVFHYAGFLSSKIPESCLLIIIGTIMGVIVHFLGVADYFRLDPQTFLLFLLPPIILEASYSINDRVFAQNIGTILLFAVLGTIFNFFLIGPTLYGLGAVGAMGEIQLSMSEALLFASFIVAVDPVAVLAIFQEVGVNNVLYFLVFGESLLNDAVTIVLYNTMKSLAQLETVSATHIMLAVGSFFTVSLGGLAIGAVFGVLTALITKKTRHVRVVEPIAIIMMAYLSYLTAELFHWSGIISMIGCGLLQAQYALENVSRKSHTTVIYFVKMLSSSFDAIIFLFLGLELVRTPHQWQTGFILWSLFLCLIYRFIVTVLLSTFANKVGRIYDISFKEQVIMWYGGLRGAVCFALVATLHDDFHLQHMFLTTTLFIVMFTVFIQGITMRPFVNLLKIKKKNTEKSKILEELNIRMLDHVMAGVEGLMDQRGDNYVREWLSRMDQKYLRRWLQVDPRSNDEQILDIYKEMQLRHYSHFITPFHEGKSLPSMPSLPQVESSASSMAVPDSTDVKIEFGADYADNEEIIDLFSKHRQEDLAQRRDRDLTREHHTDLYRYLKEHHARYQRLLSHRRRARQRQPAMRSLSLGANARGSRDNIENGITQERSSSYLHDRAAACPTPYPLGMFEDLGYDNEGLDDLELDPIGGNRKSLGTPRDSGIRERLSAPRDLGIRERLSAPRDSGSHSTATDSTHL